MIIISNWIIRLVVCQSLFLELGLAEGPVQSTSGITYLNELPDSEKSKAQTACNSLSKGDLETFYKGSNGLSYNLICTFKHDSGEAPKTPDATSLTNALVETCANSVRPAVDQCKNEQAQASVKCNPEKDQGMSSVGSAAKQIALNSAPMASMAGQSGALKGSCVMIQALSGMANAAVMAFSDGCSKERDTCIESCKLAGITVDECVSLQLAAPQNHALIGQEEGLVLMIRGRVGYDWKANGIDVCSQLATKENEANQASQNIMQALQGGMSCQGKTDGTIKGVNPVTQAAGQLCKMEPTLPGCTPAGTLDCSNPSVAAINPICKCVPGSPNCGTGANAGDMGAMNGAGGGSPSKIGATAPDLSGLLGDSSNTMGLQAPHPGDRGGGNWWKNGGRRQHRW